MPPFANAPAVMTTEHPNTDCRPSHRGRGRHAPIALVAGLALASVCTAPCAQPAASGPSATDAAAESPHGLKLLGSDIKAYMTAPLHAQRTQWVRFGATLAAIGVAYEHDDNTRHHYVDSPAPDPNHDTHDSRDAVPAALVLGGTWVSAALLEDPDGRHEARAMVEAAAFSSVAAYALKEIAGRERPYVAGDSGNWRSGGDSFPSMHVTAAFAIGTVLAESGNDRYRWIRRVLGYGVAGWTAVQRLKHDAHWLSDTVAGAGLGMATARFVMQRDDSRTRRAEVQVVPMDDGFALTYSVALR